MTWPAAVQTHFASRLPFVVQWLLYATVKPFGGGAAVSIGLWTGDDHQNLTIDGSARLYHGAQGSLRIPPIRYWVGTEIAAIEVGLAITPEGEALVRGYNTRLAPVDLHCAVFHPDTGAMLGARRMFKGLIDGTAIRTGEQEGQSEMSLRLVSAARKGTMTRVGKKSDSSQRERDPNDAFRQYADLGTVAADPWGGEP